MKIKTNFLLILISIKSSLIFGQVQEILLFDSINNETIYSVGMSSINSIAQFGLLYDSIPFYSMSWGDDLFKNKGIYLLTDPLGIEIGESKCVYNIFKEVRAFDIDQNGDSWILGTKKGSSKGIYKCTKSDTLFFNKDNSGLTIDGITSIKIGPKNDVWAYNMILNKLLYHYDGNAWKSFPEIKVDGYSIDKKGNCYAFNSVKMKIYKFIDDKWQTCFVGSDYINSIATNDTNFYFSTNSGIYRLDGIKIDTVLKNNIEKNIKFYKFAFDSKNNIWISTNYPYGFVKYNMNSKEFKIIDNITYLNKGKEELLPIDKILIDKSDNLWIIYTLYPQTNVLKYVPNLKGEYRILQ